MKCEYDDGFKVNYSGSLSIRKGDEVDLYVKEKFISSAAKSGLEAATAHNSCGELREAAYRVTDVIHGAWYQTKS
ncbi:MAG TPA: hypothetical protein VN642_05470 [Dongiaceae bacterium]|nr:hypothetical protein [Dongiaceae bacterium]